MADFVCAIDIGTSTTRAALVDRRARIVDLVASEIRLHSPQPGVAEQDPEDWWSTTVSNVRRLLERHPEACIAAVAVGGQMHGVVPVDGSGNSLARRVAIWSDKQAAPIAASVASLPDAAELAAAAGNRPVPAWAGFKIAWFRDHAPDVYARAETFLVAKDFVNQRLTGCAATDPTEASGSFLMDSASDRWSPELVRALGVDREKLPEIVPSAAVVGVVTRSAAAATGLREGTPVASGAGDMLCQLLAVGVTRPGRVCEVSGTAGIIAAYAATPSSDRRVMNLRTAGSGWVRFGIEDAGGACLNWFSEHFCADLTARARESGRSRYELVTEEAATVPVGSRGLLFFPYLLGERTLGVPESRGAFIGLSMSHRRPELGRALIEGLCFEIRRALDLIIPASEIEHIRVTGGGAGSALWNQIRADVYGHQVVTLNSIEGGIVGAGLLAATAAGWFGDAAEASEACAEMGDRWTPDPEHVREYDAAYRTFCRTHDALELLWHGWR